MRRNIKCISVRHIFTRVYVFPLCSMCIYPPLRPLVIFRESLCKSNHNDFFSVVCCNKCGNNEINLNRAAVITIIILNHPSCKWKSEVWNKRVLFKCMADKYYNAALFENGLWFCMSNKSRSNCTLFHMNWFYVVEKVSYHLIRVG